MHISVIELLRCPAGHEEAALVASATRQVARRIVEGSLGCPVCGAEYAIRRAVADLRRDPGAAGSSSAGPEDAPNEESGVRLAAQLDLTQPGRLVLLAGDYGAAAPALSVMFDARCAIVGIQRSSEPYLAEHGSVLRIDRRVPLARASLHGAAIDSRLSELLGLEHVSSLLKPHGRLVAPAHVELPVAVTRLAQDPREWVAVRSSADVVSIRRPSR